MPAIIIWDNIKIVTKNYKANSFDELKGHKIYLPLFKGAPPYIFTRYLMKLEGNNYKDFEFEFGKPFGRPKEIMENFVNGDCDTAVLCEPQVSFALHNSDNNTHISIDYGKLWKKHHPELEKLPNAGVLFNEEFVKAHPNIASLFLLELKNAVEWVKNNPREAAKLSHQKMDATIDEVEFFINNAAIKYKDSVDISEQLRLYLQILKNERVLENQDIDKTMEMFTI
jgi:NitT/TauT family transport system substrate-binding protein